MQRKKQHGIDAWSSSPLVVSSKQLCSQLLAPWTDVVYEDQHPWHGIEGSTSWHGIGSVTKLHDGAVLSGA